MMGPPSAVITWMVTFIGLSSLPTANQPKKESEA